MEPSDRQKPFTVVVGLDFSPLSDAALLAANNLASRFPGSELHAVTAIMAPYDEDPPPGLIDDLLRDAKEQVRVRLASFGLEGTAKWHSALGDAATVIADVARASRADLVVVGTHGRKGLPRLLLGSVADTLMRRAPCSVLVVRAREIGPEERIEPPRPGQDAKEHHVRALRHYEGPNEALQGFGMGALSIRP